MMGQRYYSNIYWHFTGSPKNVDWSKCTRPKDILAQGKPKDLDESVSILFKILESKTLLASSSEMISKKVLTDPFCCVTDIPLHDLNIHAKYYGKIALGFNYSCIQSTFNPVLYIPNKSFPRKTHIPNHGIEYIVDDYDNIDTHGFDIEKLENGKYKLKVKGKQIGEHMIYQVLMFGTEIQSDSLNNYFKNHIKITNFSPKIGESFYQEREWRHIGNFRFTYSDVKLIIAPEKLQKIIKEFIMNTEYSGYVTILTWELISLI